MNAKFTASTRSIQVPLERQAALARRLSEHLVEASLVGLDPAGKIRSFNAGAEALYGYTEREVLGASAALFDDSGAALVFEQALAHANVSGKWTGHLPQRDKHGARFTVELTLLLLRDATGRPEGFVAVGRDVRETARLERELRASRAAGARLLESGVELVFLANSAGSLVDANALARATLGGQDLAPGKPGATDSGATLRRLIERTLATDELHGFELTLLDACGNELDLFCDTLAVVGQSGRAEHVMIVARLEARPPESRRLPRSSGGPVKVSDARPRALRVA